MRTLHIVIYYVNNKNRTFVHTRAYISLRNIDNLVRFSHPVVIFFAPSPVCMYVREKKKKIFVLIKESACSYPIYVCIYIYIKEKSACAWSRSDNDNVTILSKEKTTRKRALYLWALG